MALVRGVPCVDVKHEQTSNQRHVERPNLGGHTATSSGTSVKRAVKARRRFAAIEPRKLSWVLGGIFCEP